MANKYKRVTLTPGEVERLERLISSRIVKLDDSIAECSKDAVLRDTNYIAEEEKLELIVLLKKITK